MDNPGGTSANSLPLTVTTQSKDFKNPEAWNWNFTVERELPLEVRGHASATSAAAVCTCSAKPTSTSPPRDVVAANPGVNLDALRPYKGYNSIRETDNVASSRYNSLQLSWQPPLLPRPAVRRVLHLLARAWTMARAQRDIIPNTYDAHNLWGPSDFDVRHILIINYLYELPFFRDHNRRRRQAAGRLAGQRHHAVPDRHTLHACSATTTTPVWAWTATNACGGAGQFWNINGTPALTHQFAYNGASDPTQWFTVTNADGSPIFTAPAAGTFSTQAVPQQIYNPGFQNWNIGLVSRSSR